MLRDTCVSNGGHCGDSALRTMRPRKWVLLRDTGVSKSEAALETWNISKFEAAADLSLVVAGTTKRLCHEPSKINTMHNECTHEHMRARQNRAKDRRGDSGSGRQSEMARMGAWTRQISAVEDLGC
jgi:hypothetical protein